MKKIAVPILIILVIIGGAAGIWYYLDQQKYVSSDKASVSVPMIQLTPKAQGVLKSIYVAEGQKVIANQAVARVNDDVILTEISGVIATTKQDIGAIYNPGQAVVTMYDPAQMKIVVSIEEDQGLNDIQIGDKVKFTVDAFGSQEFDGTVEEISPISRNGDIVFSISDKRQMQNFDVKIAYDINALPNFKNGMSAKVRIIKAQK